MDPLFPYQNEGATFLTQKKLALLADEMGLGKTVQAIRGLDSIHAGKGANPHKNFRALVVCPSVARINWLREFETWSISNRKYQVLERLDDIPKPDVTAIVSFDYAARNFRALGATRWDALIVDEAHFIKSHDAKRTLAIMGKDGLCRAADRVWLMTGTPAPNHPGELWIMLYTFGQTPLKYDDFLRRYCIVVPTSYGPKVVSANPDKIPELRQLLKSVMLRRLKKDVMKQLPPITFGHQYVEAGPVDVEILPSFTHYFLPTDKRKELGEELKRQAELLKNVYTNMDKGDGAKLSTLAGISDSVSTLRRFIGLQKCRDAIDIIYEELETKAYQKIVIFAIHRDVIETLRDGLRDFKPVTIYGGTDPEKRQKNIDRFQNNPKCRVFIGNIHAAGTAITLTAAHHVTFVEQDWVPGNNAQAIMRCHRIGQENPVSVRFIVLDGTLDAKIGSILKRKTAQLTEIFDQNP